MTPVQVPAGKPAALAETVMGSVKPLYTYPWVMLMESQVVWVQVLSDGVAVKYVLVEEVVTFRVVVAAVALPTCEVKVTELGVKVSVPVPVPVPLVVYTTTGIVRVLVP